MFMLKKTHEAELNLRDRKHEANLQRERDIDQRALDAERSITKSLREEVERLRPLADKYTARLERDRVHAANKRKAGK